MTGTCQAGYPSAAGWAECGAPAIAVHDYGCVHEHVKRRATCELHQPVPGAVGCQSCLEAGHECEMSARLVSHDGD